MQKKGWEAWSVWWQTCRVIWQTWRTTYRQSPVYIQQTLSIRINTLQGNNTAGQLMFEWTASRNPPSQNSQCSTASSSDQPHNLCSAASSNDQPHGWCSATSSSDQLHVHSIHLHLHQEQYLFGDAVLQRYTPKGWQNMPALLQLELNILKTALYKNLPHYWSCPEGFERSGPSPRKPMPKLASDLEANRLYTLCTHWAIIT